MACLIGGLTSGRSSWTAATTVTLLAIGIAALAAFVWIEARRAEPMLDLGLLRRPLFLVALARLAVESVPHASAALGSGADNTARYLGSALGIAFVVALVSAGGAGEAGLVQGFNRAALAAAALNVAGAALAAALGGVGA